MIDRDKVIEELKELCEYLFHEYKVCYNGDEEDTYNRFLSANNALELLKEQEPVELLDDGEDFVSIGDRMEITNRWKCGGCGNFVVYCETRPKIKFCHMCGREFKRG